MKKNFFCLVLIILLGALCRSAEAAQSEKVPRIVYLTSFGAPSIRQFDAFRQGLKEFGYVEGKTIVLEYRYPKDNPEGTPAIVAEVMQNKVDVFVAADTTAIRALQKATKTIPVVMLSNQDPVAAGLVESLARPGGNVTGLTQLARDRSGKRLELLKEAIPTLSRVGVLTVAGPPPTGVSTALKEYEAAARALNIPIQSLQVARGPNPDLEGVFREAVKARVGALITARNQVLSPHTKKTGELALKNRLPSMHEVKHYAEVGGLMSYGANDADLFRRAATYVDKILKGAKPANLPVEQPTKFEFVINLKTAKALNLTIPQSMLFRADKVFQ